MINPEILKKLPLKESVDKLIEILNNNKYEEGQTILDLNEFNDDNERFNLYFSVINKYLLREKLFIATQVIEEILNDIIHLQEYPLIYDNDNLFNITDDKYINNIINEILEKYSPNIKNEVINSIEDILNILKTARLEYNESIILLKMKLIYY